MLLTIFLAIVFCAAMAMMLNPALHLYRTISSSARPRRKRGK